MVWAEVLSAQCARLLELLGRGFRIAEVKERLAQFGIDPVGSTSAEFTVFLKNEVAKWAKVIKDANVKID